MDKPFPIIGIGASAGGLEALESFFSNTPGKCGMAFVVIQHLDPTRKGIMPELLQRVTDMKVVSATDRLKIKPDVVYVIPSNKNMSILHRALYLFEPVETRGLRLPIDFFFCSLAEDIQENGAGVILSGMGSDGSIGVQAIKEKGGLVMVQYPADSRFDSMPRNAINAVPVDIIATASELPERLISYFNNKPVITNTSGLLKEKSSLEKILILLRMQTGHDFSSYKNNTLYRRIERRMGVHQINKIVDYVRFLQENPREIDILFHELMIGVTHFFRDETLWKKLKEKIIPALIDRLPGGYTIRSWVPGCSTGEEAYSLAMIFKEVIENAETPKNITFQIFATDLDQAAIEKARKGDYPENIGADIDKDRLNRFFTHSEDGYRIKNDIREMVVFAPQNVIQDPPFTKIDILSCRNLLIYMETELQMKLLSLFHYCLNPGGVLVLGSAESLGGQNTFFSAIDAKLRIFQQIPNSKTANVFDFPSTFLPVRPEGYTKTRPVKVPENIQSLSDQFLLQNFAPTGVVTNDKGDIVYITGPTGCYLEAARGKAAMNVFTMAREGLKNDLSIAFRKATHSSSQVAARNIQLVSEGSRYLVDIVIQKMEKPDILSGLYLVVFSHVTVPADNGQKKAKAKENKNEIELKIFELELQRTKEELQLTIEEMQTSQEELKSANEELQSANEELQSTNEELSTSKEEMQSLNEELQTVNAELLNKVDEYTHVNNDLINLLNSTDIASLFLDKNLKIRRFTIEATRVFKLNQTDVGRLFTDIVSVLNYPDIAEDAAYVLRTLDTIEKNIPTHDGHWFSVRIMPYRTTDDRIDGLVMTFTDITLTKQLELRLNETIDALDCKLEEVKNLLSGKELILKESQHRVKNNMNIIYGLLSLQAEMNGNTELKNILNEAAGRIHCMGLLYDKLYYSKIKGPVSITPLLPDLINEIVAIFPVKGSFEIKTEIDDIILSAAKISSLVIIINELITNSMKYAFAGRDNGTISVAASIKGNLVFVIYEDNGVGIPESVSFDNSTGFGMQLIGLLAEQIGGSIQIERSAGTRFILQFEV